MTKLNQPVLNNWISALRSGQYKQTYGKLRSGDCFCAFGVLCDLYAREHNIDDPWGTPLSNFHPLFMIGQQQSAYKPPAVVCEWIGLNGNTPWGSVLIPKHIIAQVCPTLHVSGPQTIVALNDCLRIPFNLLANIIELCDNTFES